jgi:hypothetical protein
MSEARLPRQRVRDRRSGRLQVVGRGPQDEGGRAHGAARAPRIILIPGQQEARMGERAKRPDIEAIIKDPVKHFRAPRDVVTDPAFTREEKRRILDSWALDAQLLSVAEEENMAGQDRPGLREVKLALLELENSA